MLGNMRSMREELVRILEKTANLAVTHPPAPLPWTKVVASAKDPTKDPSKSALSAIKAPTVAGGTKTPGVVMNPVASPAGS